MSVAVSDIREQVHCDMQCGPTGSLSTCKDIDPDPLTWCSACGFLASLPEDGVLYDNDDIGEMEAGWDW